MSDFSRLEDKLAKLRGRELAPGEDRRLKGSGPEALIAALLEEVDETILPRRITLTGEGLALHLAAASRKVQALLAPAPDVEGAKALEGRPLVDAGDAEAAMLLAVLTRFFGAAGAAAITSARPARVFPSEVGVPAALLARAWSLRADAAGEPTDPDETLSAFLAGLGDNAEAWLRIDGENVTGTGGDPDRVAALGDQAAMFLDSYFARFDAIFPGEGGPVATLIAPQDDVGQAAFFVEIGGLSAFVAVRPGRAAAVAGLWQKLAAV